MAGWITTEGGSPPILCNMTRPTTSRLLAGSLAIGLAVVAGCTGVRAGGPRTVLAGATVDEAPPPPVRLSLPPAPADPEPDAAASDSAAVTRLMRLSYVWHLLSLHHPAAAVRGVPLDSAFIRAVTLVRRATDAPALEVAYRRFLAVLNDPLTTVERDTEDPAVAPDGMTASIAAERTSDSILVLTIPTSSRYRDGSEASLRASLTDVPAKVVLDLRTAVAGAALDSVEAFVARSELVERLASVPFMRSSVRTRRVGGAVETAQGWRFDDAWRVRDGALVMPQRPAPRRLVVLANAQTVFPRAVLGLMASTRATVIADSVPSGAPLRDDALVPRVTLFLEQGLRVTLRAGELVHADGSTGLTADTLVAAAPAVATDSAPALRAALAMLRTQRFARASRLPVVRAPAALPGYYDGDPYPFMGARVLAGARLWSAMRARHAHRDLYDDDADDVFERALPRLESARYPGEYAAALLSFVSSFDDAQVGLRGASLDSLLGVASVPFRVRWADGRVIITDVVRDSVTRALGIEPGQEVVAADGYPIPAWLLERRRFVSAPNEWSRQQQLMTLLPRGAVGTSLFRLRDVTGRERPLAVPRRPEYVRLLATVERPWRSASLALPNDIAYIDVNRLTEQTVDDALQQHRMARAWILDLRGGLTDSSRVGARVLQAVRERPLAVVAQELHRYQSLPCLAPTLREAAAQCPDERETRARVLQGDTAGHYRGRLVALVDERTVGAMERLALALEATTGVTFIGSATAGSPADAVTVSLPGGLTITVPAMELRRTDGSQWQRIGLTPLLEARLSARSYRTGGDEVLERAQAWLQQQLDTGTRRRR